MNELPKGFVSATHAVLFEPGPACCSVCAAGLTEETEGANGDDSDDDARTRGRGLLLWARGDERRYEEPELCPSCASAIGVSASQRWEIEEDEG